jgi:hypothetical protein
LKSEHCIPRISSNHALFAFITASPKAISLVTERVAFPHFKPGEMTMITAEKCRVHATECRVLASSIDTPAQRSLEQSIMALNWEALADQIDHDNSHGTPAAFSVSNLSETAAAKGCGSMPKYFFVVRHGDKTSHHSDGIAFPDIGAVQLEAIKSTGEILRNLNYPIEAGSEWRMEVVDEARRPLFSLRVIAELHE